MSATAILAVLAALVLLGMVLEGVFRKTGIPDVLILLIIGLIASVSGLFDVHHLRGVDKVFTTAALVLILFEGATRIRLSELRSALAPSLIITLLGFTLTTAIVGLLGMTLFGMRPLAGLCLGAILGGTSSAVVIPMVSVLPLNDRAKTVLTLESALSDVLCIVFTLVFLGALTPKGVAVGQAMLDLMKAFGGALVIGASLGLAWAYGLREVRARRESILVVGAAVFLVFAFAELLGLYGAIAVLAFGLVLGNAESLAGDREFAKSLALNQSEKSFLGETAFLLKVLFFVYLGAALKLDGYEPFVFGGLVTVAVFALRPIVVRASLRPKTTTRGDAVIASALVPKGLAAAVLAGLPSQSGVPEGGRIEAIVFGCVLFSITISAALAYFRDRSFVSGALGVIFRKYPEKLAPVVAAAGAQPVIAEAAQPSAEAAQPGAEPIAPETSVAGAVTSSPPDPPSATEPPAGDRETP